MASCEIIGTDYAARVTYTVTQSVEKNQSVLKVTKVELKALRAAGFPVYLAGSITVNGVKTTTLALTDTTSCGISSLTREYAGGGDGSWSGFSTKSVTVYHEDDGTAKIPIKAILSVYMARGTRKVEIGSPINKTVNVSLPTIPRVSIMTASAVELGSVMSIQISRAASSFRDTVVWSCGALSGTISEKTAETSLSWTVPMELANQAPSSTRVSITLTVSTYTGSTLVGSRAVEVQCTIPDSVVPTLTISVEDKLGYTEVFGGYVQNRSQARVLTNAAGSCGSTITSVSVNCGRLTGTGADISFALEDSGAVLIYVTVTDSRGRTASASQYIWVNAYKKPTATITDGYRCDEKGNRKPDGEWLKLEFNAQVTALSGNKAEYYAGQIIHGTDQTSWSYLSDYDGSYSVTGGSCIISAGIDTAYDCVIAARDSFCTEGSNPVLISVAFALMDFHRDTKAVGIGMRAKTAEKLSIGLNTDMNEHGIENLTDPVSEQDAATKAYVDDAVRKAALRNLLDNSDFRNPVNQRGIYSSAVGQYIIDRWYFTNSTFSGNTMIAISANGITVTNDAGADRVAIVQNFIDKNYYDGKYTSVIKTTDGLVFGHIDISDSENGICQESFWVPSGTTVVWAAMYEGSYTADTLPEYRCKGYGAELAECQRYYQIRSANNIAAADMRPTMRLSSPTITSVTGGYAYSADL